MMQKSASTIGGLAVWCGLGVLALTPAAHAVLSFTVDANGWPDAGRRNAAVSAMTEVINLYNSYGDFGNNNVYAYYNSGIPTAQANYLGSIGFGGTYPNGRVTLHESNHYFGSGTTGQWTGQFSGGVWTGAKVNALIQQFDGVGSVIRQSGVHFYGYGLNYDSENVNASIFPRNVAIMYAMRQDMGIGNAADPWSAKAVVMKQSDAFNTSSFNWRGGWNDNYFAHGGADYYSGNFLLRTPVDTYNAGATTPSFTFAGASLTLNNRGDQANGGLLFKGVGTSGVTTISTLILDAGTIRHGSGAGDVMQLAGKVKVLSPSLIAPTNGSINVNSAVSGAGKLTIGDGVGTVTFTSVSNAYRGSIDVQGRFTLAGGSPLRFVIEASGTNNAITGTAADAVALNGLFQFDLSSAATNIGSVWQIVGSVNTTYGGTFAVAGFTEVSSGVWNSPGGFKFTESDGRLTYAGPGGLSMPEPAALGLVGTAAVFLGRRRRARSETSL